LKSLAATSRTASKSREELRKIEDRFAIAVYSLGEHSDHTARADDNPIVKGNAQMSEGSSSLQRSWLFGFSISVLFTPKQDIS